MHCQPHRTMRGAALAVTALVSLVAGCHDPASPTAARMPVAPSANTDAEPADDPATPLADVMAGPQEMIAFASDRAGSFDVYVMEVATGRSHRLTRGKGPHTSPAWSPDGKQIALASMRDGNLDIYVMSASGGSPVRLTVDATWDDSPTWSPDGMKIAYASGAGAGGDVFVRNADATGPSINLTNNPGWDSDPAWSPVGAKIAFASSRGTPAGAEPVYDLHLMNADGTGVTRLTTGGARGPAWSPDGQKIAYYAYRDGGWRIYVVDANGTGSPVKLSTQPAASDFYPRWSRDGTKIVFTSGRAGSYDIYTMNSDGTDLTRIGGTSGRDWHPAWRP